MKIRQWLGFNEDASQYLLRPGELRTLNNLQSRRPGMLIARLGLSKIYGKYDNEMIRFIYRRATRVGEPSDLLWLQKVLVPRELTGAQLAANESPFEYVWMVRRIQGNQYRVIDTQKISPNGLSDIESLCVAEDRHGRLFIFYGNGARPRMYRPTDLGNVAFDMGLDAPLAAPSVIPSGSGYFLEGVDVQFGGGAYYQPPELTLTGGNPSRPARLKAVVQSGNVVGAEIIDGGANYQTPPTITAAADKVGSGFRARGNVTTTARTIEGFSETDAGTITGTAATSTQTYGSENGTEGNKILYLSQPRSTTSKIAVVNGTALTMSSVAGISVGDIVTVYPAAAPFNNSTVTVTAVNATTGVITISASFTPVAGTAYEATFSRPAVVAEAQADYDPVRRRFFANVPLASNSATGSGAFATLEFAPVPRGFGLNQSSNSSIAVTNQNFMSQYINGDFWEGSEYDNKGSAENARYGGLQASGAQFVRGFSGSVNNRRADVYWPDYSRISVWFCTGVLSNNINQWTRQDVAVTTEINNGVASKVLQFRLRPTRQAKKVTSLGGSTIATEYDPYEELPDAIAPEVKIYLRECPDSWIVSEGDNCLPTSIKEEQTSRLPWWTSGTNVSRPLVGITPTGVPISASAVTVTDTGRGWQRDTVFAFRLYQANPYAQQIDYNTAVVEEAIPASHSFYSAADKYVEFRLTANTPDNLTPHGPPNFLVPPAQVTIPGDGYGSGATGTITLYRRDLTAAVTAAVPSLTISWTAKILNTLSATSTGHIASITILNKGRNYFAPPTIEVKNAGTGYGLSVVPQVVDGRIESLQILDPGAGYTTPPELGTSARAAQLTPVMRPTLKGRYRCAYRFIDQTETLVATVTATRGESSTTLTLSDSSAVKPGMILEASSLPHYSRVVSVNGSQVEINQQATGLAPSTTISVKVRDFSKPISCSDLSPIADVDVGPNAERSHSSLLTWSLPGVRPPARADKVELWRTSADQSLVFYRVEAYGIPSADGVQIVGTDTLTDEELFDPERPHYAAMPVVLPNGSVNAYRFGKPRDDMSVCVAFQDRLWYGVSTSGRDTNTLFYSEFDEFESTPDVNELPIQNNQKSTDVLTALVPFGSLLLAMQHTHTYALTYNSDPAVDASIQMLSHRGCLHQRCWDLHENILYAADESGIYAMTRSGEVQDISLPVRDYFISEVIDFSKRDTFFLQADPRTHIIRFFCVLKTNPTETPSVALCYDVQAKTWWTESYPNSITAACTGRPGDARINTILLGAVDGNLYEMSTNSDHANDTLTDAFITQPGSGYYEAPKITVPSCQGAIVQGVVSEGRLVDVVIQNSGWGALGGIGLAAENGKPLTSQDGRTLAGVEYWPIRLNIAPPEPGGVQAVAYANFSVTPRVVRECTVTQGESFVRVDPARTAQLQPLVLPSLETQAGGILVTQALVPITTEPPPVEIGMEAIGDFVPMNSFVSHISGRDIYLKHPDGTPVAMLYGAARTNAPNTSLDYLEDGGTPMRVTFRKPFRTHIPFRMVTGAMQLINDENARDGGGLIDRSVTLVYSPTAGDKTIELLERFNGREELRPNIARRERTGPGGFVHRQDSASTVLNMNRKASHLGVSNGVAKAKFASRVSADLASEDQHLQVELYARPEQASSWKRENFWIANPSISAAQPVVLHSMTVNGVLEDAE